MLRASTPTAPNSNAELSKPGFGLVRGSKVLNPGDGSPGTGLLKSGPAMGDGSSGTGLLKSGPTTTSGVGCSSIVNSI